MPTSKADLSSLSTQELLEEFAAELARRRAAQAPEEDMSTMELALEAEAEALKRASLAWRLERRGNEEDDSPKPCPRCGEWVAVKVKKRPRQVRTLSGPQEVRRNYHVTVHGVDVRCLYISCSEGRGPNRFAL
jgi:hypothetical protein